MRLRAISCFVFAVILCSTVFAQVPSSPVVSTSEHLTADAPRTTVQGNTFIAPKGWSIRVKGPATIVEAPEGDSSIALIDVQAKTHEEALAAAWRAYKPDAKWTVKVTHICPTKMAGADVASTNT
jgi:hypothetical protein